MVFQKGQPKHPDSGKRKGQKNKKTIEKEERRRIFEERISQKWETIINQLPPIYVADQFMGKAETPIIIKTGPTEEDKKLAQKLSELERDNG